MLIPLTGVSALNRLNLLSLEFIGLSPASKQEERDRVGRDKKGKERERREGERERSKEEGRKKKG